MSKKNSIAKELHALQAEMSNLESKRSRSMAVIIEALVARVEPNPEDLQFFRTYSAEIELKREQVQKLTRQLENELR